MPFLHRQQPCHMDSGPTCMRILKKVILLTLSVFPAQTSFSKEALKDNGRKENLSFHMNYHVSDTATINIKINNGRLASFYYTDEFGDTDPPCFLSAKDHIKKLNITHPTLLIDSYHQIPFLIYPGERLTLKVNDDGLPEFTVDGDSTRNNDLYFFVAYYKGLNRILNSVLYEPPKIFTLSKSEFDFQKVINRAKKDSAKRLAFLRSYQKSVIITSEFARYAQLIFKFLYIIDVLKPIYYKGTNVDKLPTRYRGYVDSIKSSFTCDSCLLNESYRRASLSLRYYLTRKIKQGNKEFTLRYDTIGASFTGATKRYLLFTELKNYMSASPINYENKYNAFLNEKNDRYSIYLTRQRMLANRFKMDVDTKKEISDMDGKKYTWQEFISKYKGYTIYLDFWASWCSPCRYNIALSEKLKLDFKDKKILFLDISIDDSPLAWQKAVHDDYMDEKMNFFLIDEKNSGTKKRFQISTIPRYVIIDKNGLIVDDNAIYPDNAQIKKVLNDYIHR